MMRRRRGLKLPAVAGAALLALSGSPAPAADGAANFPNKPIRIVVPSAPGGGNDVIARMLGPELTKSWKQQVVADNRPGAGGIVGSQLVAKSPPDGHTLLIVAMGYAVNPSMYAKLPYDTLKDFERVTVVARTPHVLVLHPSVPFRSLQELIAYARAKPEQITFASSGVGTAGHLCLELLKSMTGIRVTHVPFKGTESVGAVVGGQVQMLFTAIAAVMPQIKAGRLKPLVTTGSARSPELPRVPTAAESGLKGYEVVGFYGVLAPGGTPPEIVARLRDEIVRAIQVPEIKTRLEGLGFEPAGSTPEEFTELVKGEMAKWARVIKDAGIKPEL